MDHSSDILAVRIGEVVRVHRELERWTATELAERSGLSRTIVSRIETGEGNPSIGTLWKIARALRVPLSSLLAEDAAPRTRVVRAGEGPKIDDPSGMVGRLVHGADRERRSEIFALELPAGARHHGEAHAPGVEEVVVVTRGKLEVGPERAPETLGPGDALWFGADVPHVYAALGRTPCHLQDWLLYPPS